MLMRIYPGSISILVVIGILAFQKLTTRLQDALIQIESQLHDEYLVSLTSDLQSQTQEHGFLRIDKNGRYFAFDDGTSFIPIGLNKFALYQETDQLIDSMLAKWSAHGINYLRIWVGIGADPEIAVGTFDMERIRKLDFIVRQSAKYGIYLSICFWNENSLRTGNGEWGWDGQQQIYNLANILSGTTINADDLKDVTDMASYNAMRDRYTYFIHR